VARLLIAHRAGNDLDELRKAFAIGVDYAETDVWLYRGRLEARHDKTAGPLPFLWERWSLKPGWKHRLVLSDVVRASIGKGRLYLDLKGTEERLPKAVAVELRMMGVEEVAFSSPNWWYLDELKNEFPKAGLFYTISNLDLLAAARPRLERGDFKAIAIHGDVVTKEVISELRSKGVADITTWGVETAQRAREMFDRGVNGVTSQNLELLAELRKGG
jgi:glycerophosphoryl diester phosphodiesterase